MDGSPGHPRVHGAWLLQANMIVGIGVPRPIDLKRTEGRAELLGGARLVYDATLAGDGFEPLVPRHGKPGISEASRASRTAPAPARAVLVAGCASVSYSKRGKLERCVKCLTG